MATIIPLTLKMYGFLIQPIRQADQQDGNQFVERFLEGGQQTWDDTMTKVQEIPDLWSIVDCPDEFLVFLKNIVGWTAELSGVTDALSNDDLRRLISVSGELWKERGPEDTVIDVITFLAKTRVRIWNWFDFRWVLDETELGEEHEGRDPWIINLPTTPDDEFRSNVRIMDLDGTLNRPLVRNILKLMRPAGERFEINWVDFLDLFRADDDTQWTKPIGLLVENGLLKLDDNTTAEESQINLGAVPLTWSEYVFAARLRGTSTASGVRWGTQFYHTDSLNFYSVRVDRVDQELILRRVVAGVPTDLVTLDLTTTALTIFENTFYTIRVVTTLESGSLRIQVSIDGSELINHLDGTPLAAGSVGVFHDASATVQLDEAEVFLVPADTETIDINS